MVIDLLGVIEDGTTRASTVPKIAGREIQFAAGETVTVRLTVVKPDGEPADTVATYTLTIKKRTKDGDALAAKNGTPMPLDGPGRLNFTIASNDTKDAEPGRYVYDIWRIDGTNKMPVISALPVLLRPRCLLP
jgi:hypothetical protein